jgi:23S rRNA (cytosine1962-C5)-methyltransferase
MVSITLKKHHDRRVRNGHGWVFSNEIYSMQGEPSQGEVIEAYDSAGKFVGIGYYNANSLIAFRLLSRDKTTVDAAFYRNRIAAAVQHRAVFCQGFEGVRLVHSESDGLPGVTIDQIGSVVSIQIVSAGADNHTDFIVDAIKSTINPDFIVLKNESALRNFEGLPLYTKVVHGEDSLPPVKFEEHGLIYEADVLEGQKTGFYIDQRENRLAFRRCISENCSVLDAFCNEGGFALNAAKAGAGSVLAIDNSESALERAKQNAKRNKLDKKIEYQKEDLMKWLPDNADTLKFDVINLDPPSFAKNKKSAGSALRGYQKIHEAALKMLNPGGYLATATCSHHIETDRFYKTVTDAASKFNKQVILVYRGSQPPDHPVHPGMPETEYLRFFIFRLVP